MSMDKHGGAGAKVQSIPILCERLFSVLDGIGAAFEIILLNDGSKDNTDAALRAAAALPTAIGR
jgi:hypothetical protein